MSYYAESRLGRYSPSELSVTFEPRGNSSALRPFFYAHGANGNGLQAYDGVNQKGVTKNLAALAHEGLYGLSGDFGGPHTYGNDTGLAAMEGAWTYAQDTGRCKTDKVILLGASMGAMECLRFALAHPTLVAGIICWIPAIDIEDFRTRNVLSLRDQINTGNSVAGQGWGLPAGSYIGGADQTPVPTRGKPLDPANMAVLTMPIHLFYSSGDTACTSTAVDAYAAGRPNVTKHLVSTSLNHTDAAILAASIDDVVTLCRGWAA
jgi:pimeloyl-ACP methyl ester carboxylesterase